MEKFMIYPIIEADIINSDDNIDNTINFNK